MCGRWVAAAAAPGAPDEVLVIATGVLIAINYRSTSSNSSCRISGKIRVTVTVTVTLTTALIGVAVGVGRRLAGERCGDARPVLVTSVPLLVGNATVFYSLPIAAIAADTCFSPALAGLGGEVEGLRVLRGDAVVRADLDDLAFSERLLWTKPNRPHGVPARMAQKKQEKERANTSGVGSKIERKNKNPELD